MFCHLSVYSWIQTYNSIIIEHVSGPNELCGTEYIAPNPTKQKNVWKEELPLSLPAGCDFILKRDLAQSDCG